MSPADRLADGSAAIFLFHGVVERSAYRVRNYTGKHLVLRRFRAIVEALAARGRPVSMDDLVGMLRDGVPLPPRAFAVTFDDGFENNVSVAAPVLRDLGVPATFYVTSDFIENDRMSWIDRIEHVLEHAEPGVLELPWSAAPRRFDAPAERIALLREIRAEVKGDARIDADALVESIAGQCGVEAVDRSGDPLDRKMSWTQVRELDRDPLFTVGGHGHRHRILSYLDEAALAEEIDLSMGLLEDRAGITAVHYSYPEGLEHCYSEGVIDALRDAGVICCPTAVDGTNRPGDDLFRLRRIDVTPAPAAPPAPPAPNAGRETCAASPAT